MIVEIDTISKLQKRETLYSTRTQVIFAQVTFLHGRLVLIINTIFIESKFSQLFTNALLFSLVFSNAQLLINSDNKIIIPVNVWNTVTLLLIFMIRFTGFKIRLHILDNVRVESCNICQLQELEHNAKQVQF